jgi:hypothetical protein
MSARFLVAKYAPDVARMEPKNIGIVLWSDGVVEPRFIASETAEFVDDKDNFDRWVSFWESQCKKPEISLRGKAAVPRSSEEFLDALRTTQKGNFLLYDAGRVREELATEDVAGAANFLFRELVTGGRHPGEHAGAVDDFKTECDELMAEAGLTSRPDWLGSSQVTCRIENVDQEFTFNYVLGNGKPRVVGQRVVESSQSVNSAAFMLEWIGRSNKVRAKKRRLATIDSRRNRHAEHHAALLGKFATVVDLANKAKARSQLEAAAA